MQANAIISKIKELSKQLEKPDKKIIIYCGIEAAKAIEECGYKIIDAGYGYIEVVKEN